MCVCVKGRKGCSLRQTEANLTNVQNEVRKHREVLKDKKTENVYYDSVLASLCLKRVIRREPFWGLVCLFLQCLCTCRKYLKFFYAIK